MSARTRAKAKPRAKVKVVKAEPAVWVARPTVYRGIQMRSRLEAAWAEQLDAFGIEWQYEPCAYASEEGQYLPDFRIPGSPVFLEVKTQSWFACTTEDRTVLCGRMLRILRASIPNARLWILTNADAEGMVHTVEVLLTERGNEYFEVVSCPAGAVPVPSLYARGFWKRSG